jgi:hypothetical protein
VSTRNESGQVLYCIQRWCTESGRQPNEATVIIHPRVGWSLSCDSCTCEWQLRYPAARLVRVQLSPDELWADPRPDVPALPDRIVIVLLSAEHVSAILETSYLEEMAASASVLYCRHSISCRNPATVLVRFLSQAPKPSCDGCARRTWESYPGDTQLSPLGEYIDWFAEVKQASLATPGQVIRGEAITSPGPAYQEPAPAPAGNGFTAEEPVAAAPAPQGLFAQLRQAWRDYKGWKTQLPAGQRLGVEAAETAAAFGAWGAVHHRVKEDQRKTRESLLHIAPMNNVQAGMWRGEERREQARVRQQQDQMAADLRTIARPQQQPVVYGTSALGGQRRTPRSDIYGNFV